MWIVELALRRPYTFVVMALAIIVFGGVAIFRMPVDIFPDIDIPVASVVWTYGGVSPEEMADGITTHSERSLPPVSTTSSTWNRSRWPGTAIIKIFFHPASSVDAAIAEITRRPIAWFAFFRRDPAPGGNSAITQRACRFYSSGFRATP